MYQINKCLDENFHYCTLKPPRIPIKKFKEISVIPAPLLDESKKHYQAFSELYGSLPNEKDKPSLKFSLEAIAEDKVS